MSPGAIVRAILPGSADCLCARSRLGYRADWRFHTPTGCADTAEKLAGAQRRFARMAEGAV